MAPNEQEIEVVRVIGTRCLIDSRSRLRTYCQPERDVPERAYYVVVRRSPASPDSEYGADAVFFGPYQRPSQAHVVARRMAQHVVPPQPAADTPALLRPANVYPLKRPRRLA